MAQLIMNWKNDGIQAKEVSFPEGVSLIRYTEIADATDVWLDIIKYLSPEPMENLTSEFFHRHMLSLENFKEHNCCFLTVDGSPAATITVVCDYSDKHGYIHMVVCKPEFRGRGLGRLLNDIALYILKKEGMETAHLTTDDWRIPAIKSYIKAGFFPDLETEPDFKERWEKIYSEINQK